MKMFEAVLDSRFPIRGSLQNPAACTGIFVENDLAEVGSSGQRKHHWYLKAQDSAFMVKRVRLIKLA